MNGAAKKILLIEDEPIAKALYQNRLQSEGFDVSIAGDGEGALNELSKAQADLVVLDLMLPRVNGEEALKQIRSNDRLKGAPVLVISNAYMTEMSQRAMESGATRGLLKTECTPARLVETIRDLLGYRSAFDVSNAAVDDDKSIEEFANAAEKALADEIKLKETREEFIKKSPGDIARIRETCRAYVKAAATGAEAASEPLSNLYQLVRFFATRAGLSGCVPIALVANAFEALLFDVLFKPSRATPSVAQTFAQAVDSLERLCQAKDGGVRDVIPRAKILVVDDDPVCNLAMSAALKRAHFEPVTIEDSTKVMTLAKSTQFDIVMLDINMPGMNGFELCKTLRSMPQYKETPVIFITANADFQNRAQGILSGGNDLIPKPVSPLELVLKVTMRLLQPQSGPAEGARAATPGAPASNAAAETAPAPVPAVPKQKAQPKDVKPKEPEAPQLPKAVKQESSFSTEMLRKAWSGDRPEGGKENEKPASAHGANGAEKVPAPDTKVELPKIETASGKDKETDARISAEEKRKLDLESISVGPLKMADEDKPKHVNGVDKTDELKQMESKIELPKVDAPKAETATVETAKVEAPTAEAPKAEIPKVEAPKVETPKVELPKVEAPKVEAHKTEAPKAEIPKVETPKVETPKVETPKVETPKVETHKVEVPKVEVPKVETPSPASVEAHQPKPDTKPEPPPTPKATEEKPAAPVSKAEKPISPDPKPQHKDPNMETTKKPTLDEAARGVARIIFGDENISDMNVRLTRIALERYNVPGTQKLDDVARGVSQIIFGDDKVSEMNVRLTRIALERYNVADVLHLNGSNGSNGTNGSH